MSDRLGNLMRAAINRNSGGGHDAPPADEFEAVARRLGCVDVATLRTLAPDAAGLAGAALGTKLRAELMTRPYLTRDEGAAVERFHPFGTNLDGGGTSAQQTQPRRGPSMNDLIREATGHLDRPVEIATNGVPLR